jgi:hypothetical protein
MLIMPQDVDISSSYLCGYLTIRGLTGLPKLGYLTLSSRTQEQAQMTGLR